MKKVKVTSEVDMYECEECKSQFMCGWDARSCERNHERNRCPHAQQTTALTMVDRSAHIVFTCVDCASNVGRVEGDISYETLQSVIKQVRAECT